MPTEIQNEANRNSISSRNAVSHGLFSAADILHPDEINEFSELDAAMRKDLAAQGALEETLASEIIRAAWRLRRCASVENYLVDIDPFTDPMTNEAIARTQKAVDRARAQTHTILQRSLTTLRRLQKERQRLPEPETKQTQSVPQSPEKDTPRNAPCPCGSGQKHKRCCGRNAPAVLGLPMRRAA